MNNYLKKDILSETPGSSFYVDRRKITIDHWLGGDPTKSNETAWRETLAQNPALLKIEEYIPWSDVQGIDPAVRGKLKELIQARTLAADKIRIDDEDKLAVQRINGSYSARSGFIGRDSSRSDEICSHLRLM